MTGLIVLIYFLMFKAEKLNGYYAASEIVKFVEYSKKA